MVVLLLLVVAVVLFWIYAKSWSARESQNFEVIHSAVKRAFDTDEPVEVQSGTTAAASKFFELYGTTEKKYESAINPVAYMGYVRIDSKEEVIAVVLRHNRGVTVTTHSRPYGLGSDSEKMQYLRSILQKYKTAANQG